MALGQRFVSADIKEVRSNVWLTTITFSYYGLYDFTESNISNSLIDAVRWLANERCGGSLQVVNVQNVVV